MAINLANIQNGERIIDLGCGPGYLSFDLLDLVGSTGRIYCLDNSEKFIDFIMDQSMESLSPIKLDIKNDIPKYRKLLQSVDKVICRWVLMFVGQTEKIIEDIYNLLRPGGKFISMEYFDFKQIAINPSSDSFDLIFDNVRKLLNNNGGDADVGSKVSEIMKSTGFKKVKTFPIYKKGEVNSKVWKWLEQTNINHINLVEAGLIKEIDLEKFNAEWEIRSKNRDAFISAPPLMISVGEK